MKIGILTLTLHTNYGGILQAYALQTVLERMGHEVVVFNRPFTPLKTKWGQIPKRIIKKLLGRDVVIFSERKYNREAPILNQHVREFRKKYIHERIVDKLTDIKGGDVDCIVVGSDQVWRPKYFKEQWQTGIEDAFLSFLGEASNKRIAYAASFGTDEWEYTGQETRRCAELLQKFDAVSVRESSAVGLCCKRLGYDGAQHVLDPTMLLSKDDYIRLVLNAKTPQSKGNLMCYFLNGTVEKQHLVERIAKERGMTLFHTEVPTNSVAPPVEHWLRGFMDADLVVTDSFHACVFSIIFGKPFVVVGNQRRGMSRFTSLMSMFGLESHLIGSPIEYNSRESYAISADVNGILEIKQKESVSFLEASLLLNR